MKAHATIRIFFASNAVIFSMLATSSASAWTASTEYMNNFSGCDSPCNGNSTLSYTDDQIGLFDIEWLRSGNTVTHAWNNGSVWSTDLIEDRDFNGLDYQNSDDVQMYVYSGHGGNGNNQWGESFFIPTCRGLNGFSCDVDIENARLGEYFGEYVSPHPGALNWAIFMTCDSVDTSPDQQWGQTMWYGLDYVMGFRGTSADSSFTSADAGNLVDDTFGLNHVYAFKSAWLDDADVDWIFGGDTPEVIAPGVGLSDALFRRDNDGAPTTTRRANNNQTAATAFAWSWTD
jgi:hypothetical protein